MKYFASFGIFISLLFASVACAQQPAVSTEGATNRSEFSATLNGEARLTSEFPFGRVYFEYGRTQQYGSRTSEVNITESQSFSETISGLRPQLGYNFRAMLIASDGTLIRGGNRSFITTPDNDENPSVPPRDDGDNPARDPEPVDEDERESDNSFFTDEYGNSCQSSDTRALYTDENGNFVGGNRTAEVNVNGQFQNFVCPETFEELTGEDAGTETGGVTVGEPAGPGLGAGGSLIGNSREGEVERVANADFEAGRLVPICTQKNELGQPIVGGARGATHCSFVDFVTLIQNVMRYLIYLTALMLVASIVYAGFKIIFKGDSATARSEGKNILNSTVKGLLLTMFAFLLINTVIGIFTDTGTTRLFIEGEQATDNRSN